MDSAGGKESKADNPEIKAAAGDRQLPPSDKGSLSEMRLVAEPADQTKTGNLDTSGMTDNELKWERDVFRDVLNNVNQTLRFQIQMAIPLLAACVTVLNIIPPQAHQEMLNELDRWVFIPALVSIGIAYRALEFHWYSYKGVSKLDADIHHLYKLVQYKHRMVRFCILCQGVGLVLLMVFVLLEYK